MWIRIQPFQLCESETKPKPKRKSTRKLKHYNLKSKSDCSNQKRNRNQQFNWKRTFELLFVSRNWIKSLKLDVHISYSIVWLFNIVFDNKMSNGPLINSKNMEKPPISWKNHSETQFEIFLAFKTFFEQAFKFSVIIRGCS